MMVKEAYEEIMGIEKEAGLLDAVKKHNIAKDRQKFSAFSKSLNSAAPRIDTGALTKKMQRPGTSWARDLGAQIKQNY